MIKQCRDQQKLARTRKSLESEFNTYCSDVRVIDTDTGEIKTVRKHTYDTALNRTKQLRKGRDE